jgi:cellulose biosynthesis protein BcsQ
MTHPIVAVCSNKGGVGKTTFATNLAVYARALNDDLSVLLVSLDDQSVIDRMFRIRPPIQGEGHLKHGWAERSFDRVMQLGQYGVQFIPPPPDTGLLKHRAEDPRTLQRILARTDFSGLVILDTKSDLEALTQNALHAAALAVLPVADWTSLEEAGKIFEMRERRRLGLDARVLLTLVDRRTRVDASGRDLHEMLALEIDKRGWPRFRTHLSRSPRVESLISATRNPGSILHHARGTQVYTQMRELSEEVLSALGLARAVVAEQAPTPAGAAAAVKRAFLRGLRGS